MRGEREYLRAAEIAALTGASLRTVRRWIRDEILPSTKLGGARLVATADLKAVLSPPHGQKTTDDGDEYDAESQAMTAIGKASAKNTFHVR